jgi:WS/DGAT C-terminal domain
MLSSETPNAHQHTLKVAVVDMTGFEGTPTFETFREVFRLTEFYSVGPLVAGAALNVTVWSYVDQLSVSVLADDETLRDTHDVTDAFVEAFTELREAAGLMVER